MKWQIDRLKNAQAIIAVPGCPAKCDIKLLKDAGFVPTKVVESYKVCDFKPWGMELTDIPLQERQGLINKLSEAIEQEIDGLISQFKG